MLYISRFEDTQDGRFLSTHQGFPTFSGPLSPLITSVTASIEDGVTIMWNNIRDENFTCIESYKLDVTYEDADGETQQLYSVDDLDHTGDGTFFARGELI